MIEIDAELDLESVVRFEARRLVAEQRQGGRCRSDEGKTGIGALLREGRALGEEPVAGMDTVTSAAQCRSDEGRRIVKKLAARSDVLIEKCDINTGAVIDFMMSKVMPPSTNSRSREWP